MFGISPVITNTLPSGVALTVVSIVFMNVCKERKREKSKRESKRKRKEKIKREREIVKDNTTFLKTLINLSESEEVPACVCVYVSECVHCLRVFVSLGHVFLVCRCVLLQNECQGGRLTRIFAVTDSTYASMSLFESSMACCVFFLEQCLVIFACMYICLCSKERERERESTVRCRHVSGVCCEVSLPYRL